MDWKDFFSLKVSMGPKPYFHSDLQVCADFSMEDLMLREFMNFGIDPSEMKDLSLSHRKILLRFDAFSSAEFDRIADNFYQHLLQDKSPELFFQVHGGGLYLILSLMRKPPLTKIIYCQTSEIPLNLFKLSQEIHSNIRLTHRPEVFGTFDKLPSLWQQSPTLSLFEVDESESRVA